MKITSSKNLNNVFNKIIEENFPNLKKEMAIGYRIPIEHQINGTKKRKSSPNNQNTKHTEQ